MASPLQAIRTEWAHWEGDFDGDELKLPVRDKGQREGPHKGPVLDKD